MTASSTAKIRLPDTIREALFKPVDAASVAVFRIGFGLIMLTDAILHHGNDLTAVYVEPEFLFRYYGFEWVPLLREHVFTVHVVMGVASLGIILGKFYRSSVALVGLSAAWIFLQDQTHYLNHAYMLILYCIIMFFIPANRYWALDAVRRPRIASNTLPSWCRLLLILQIEVILIWAGIVKLNPDWLQLEPLAHWLAKREAMPLFGPLFVQPWAVAVAAYGVIALHLAGAPLLLFRRTRLYVLAAYGGFHLLNHFVFTIGVFPWVTFFASLICFEPDWPRRVWSRWRRRVYEPPPLDRLELPSGPWQMAIVTLLGVWLVFQVCMPMRNWFYDGWVAWNEQGHAFSWRMKLRQKNGAARYLIVDPETGNRYVLHPEKFLVGRQKTWLPCRPDMILQMAHYMRDRLAPEGKRIENPEIYVDARCALNYREPQRLIDSRINLAKVERKLTGNDWITKLDTPLRPQSWWALVGQPPSEGRARTAGGEARSDQTTVAETEN